MTTDTSSTSIRASRGRVPRSRGALGGVLVLLLGAWAALVPFFGPYINLAFTPAANDAWRWTSARGWLEVLPGAAAFVGGLLLLLSASRIVASIGGWLAVAGGAWLVIGPPLAETLNIDLGTPDPTSSTGVRALEALLFFYAIGAAIILCAALALGRLSVLGVRDVRAAERRAADDAALVAETRGRHEGGRIDAGPDAPRYERDGRDGDAAAPPYQRDGSATAPPYEAPTREERMTVPHRDGRPDAPPPDARA